MRRLLLLLALFAACGLPPAVSRAEPPSWQRTRVTSDPTTTKIGAWQNQTFAADKIRPIGTWLLVGGNDLASYNNLRVKLVDPDRAISRTASDGFGWSQWEAPWRRVYPDWTSALAALFDENPSSGAGEPNGVMDVLWPGGFSGVAPAATDPRPMVCFWMPNGALQDDRNNNSVDFFTVATARSFGCDHLVDGFYENLKKLDSLGVKCSVHVGAPGFESRFTLRGGSFSAGVARGAAYLEQCRYFEHSNALVGLDASVLRPQDGIDEATVDRFLATGQGAAVEGIPDPTDATQAAWLAKSSLAIQTTFRNDCQRIGLGPIAQSSGAVGHWPLAGSSQFTTAFGANRCFIFLFYESEPLASLTFPSDAWTNNTAADAYLASLQTLTRACLTEVPNAKLLLPYQVICLCGKRAKPLSDFVP